MLTLVLAVAPGLEPAKAQIDPTYQNRDESDIFGNGSEVAGSSPNLDATNLMDLINRLRQSEAMRDATPPSDAIDAGLDGLSAGCPLRPPRLIHEGNE